MSVTYDGAEYFYLKNAQGDVTGLVAAAWPRCIAQTGCRCIPDFCA